MPFDCPLWSPARCTQAWESLCFSEGDAVPFLVMHTGWLVHVNLLSSDQNSISENKVHMEVHSIPSPAFFLCNSVSGFMYVPVINTVVSLSHVDVLRIHLKLNAQSQRLYESLYTLSFVCLSVCLSITVSSYTHTHTNFHLLT